MSETLQTFVDYIISIFGSYTPLQYTYLKDGVECIGYCFNWNWAAAVFLFSIVLVLVLRGLFGIIRSVIR